MTRVLTEEERGKKGITAAATAAVLVPRSYAVVGGFDTGSILEKYLPSQCEVQQKQCTACTDADSNMYPLLLHPQQVLPSSSSTSTKQDRDGGWNSPLITARITNYLHTDAATCSEEDCCSSIASSISSTSISSRNHHVRKILFNVGNEEKDEVAESKLGVHASLKMGDDEEKLDSTVKHSMEHTFLMNATSCHDVVQSDTKALEEKKISKNNFDNPNSLTMKSAHQKTVQFDVDFGNKINGKVAVASALSSPPLVTRHRKQQQQQQLSSFTSSSQTGQLLVLQEARDARDKSSEFRVYNTGTDTTFIRHSSSAHRAKKMWQTRTLKYVDSTNTSNTYESLADSIVQQNEDAIVSAETVCNDTTIDDVGILKEKSVAAKVAVAGTVAARKFENMYGKHLSSPQIISLNNNEDDANSKLEEIMEGEVKLASNEEKESLIAWLRGIMLADCPSSLYPIHMSRTVVDKMIQHVTDQVQVRLKQAPLEDNIQFEDREDTISTTSAVVVINTPTPTKTKHIIHNTRTPQTTSTNETCNSNRADWGSDYDDSPLKHKSTNNDTTKLIHPITAHNVLHVIQSFLEWIIDIASHTGVPYPNIVDLLLFDCSSSKGYIINRLATEQLNDYDYYHLFHQVIFSTEDDHVVPLLSFFKEACHRASISQKEQEVTVMKQGIEEKEIRTEAAEASSPMQSHRCTTPRTSNNNGSHPRVMTLPAYFKPPPRSRPSPAEIALSHRSPHLLLKIHSFLGDPVTICRLKQVCKSFNEYISKNHHAFFKQSVRIGGMRESTRPKFWLWITLNKCRGEEGISRENRYSNDQGEGDCKTHGSRSHHLEPWHKQSYSFNESSVHPDRYGWEDIDASAHNKSDSSFYEDDSSWVNISMSSNYQANIAANEHASKLLPSKLHEKHEKVKGIAKKHPRDDFSLLEHIGREGKWHSIIARDVARAFGTLPPHKTKSCRKKDSIVRALVRMKKELGCHQQQRRHKYFTIDEDTREESLSDGLSSSYGDNDSVESKSSIPESELALSGVLAQDTREMLQQKLAAVLHALAAAYDDVGYCQGVDYVVCHLMRILQDTIVSFAKSGRLPSSLLAKYNSIPTTTSSSVVVEETLFYIMDCFFSYYNLKHMYWPELRFLKRTCQVFQRLIERKLPVLADHFEHHELNVSLFALGWFQTLFLYIPSMPIATVSGAGATVASWLISADFN